MGFFAFGWLNNKNFRRKIDLIPEKLSIILPFRNEAENLENVISDLLDQDYPAEFMEILAINDHSTDDFWKIINCFKDKRLKIISLNENQEGKKQAILLGLEKSACSIIVSVDADCRYSKKWLSNMLAFRQKKNAEMVFGPVDFICEKSVFSKIQNLEFLSLIGSGAGAASIGNPIFCNGANLLYKRQEFQKNNILYESNASGDDVFLLHGIKKNGGKICFLKSKEAICYTHAPENLKEFVSQRKRWASKAKNYKDSDSVIVSLIVFLNAFSLIVLGFASIFSPLCFYVFLALFSSKCLIDLLLFIPVLRFFRKETLLIWFIPVQPIYIAYVSFIGIFGTLGKINWKGRIS